MDLILTLVVLSFWILFPIGMFLAVSHLERSNNELLQMKKVSSVRRRRHINRAVLLPH